MLERIATTAELRHAVQQMGAFLLCQADRSEMPGPAMVHDFLPEGTTAPPQHTNKGTRYGYGNAISGLLRAYLIQGRGPQAQFRWTPEPEHIKGRQPRVRMLHGVRQILAQAARHFNGEDGPHTVLMDTFTEHSKDIPGQRGAIRSGQAILGGGDYLHGICEYSFVLGDLMGRDAGFARASAEVRRDAAHGILRRVMGREAVMHMADFLAAATVQELHDDGEVRLRRPRESGDYVLDLAGNRRAAALRQTNASSHDTPQLGCAAHILRPGEPETDLQTFIHAGVNYAHDMSLFGPPAVT